MPTHPVHSLFVIFAALAVVFPSCLSAQKDTLGIAPVQPTPALAKAVSGEGKSSQMDQVLQSLDEQLVDRIHAGRKFEIVARGDLKILLTEQALGASGNVDSTDKAAAQQFKLAGAKYVLATKIDGFKDFGRTSSVGETGQKATIRVLSVSVIAKIYDPTTGRLYESISFQARKEDKKLSLNRAEENVALSDELLVGVARDLADRIANRVADVLFPAMIIGRSGKQITINRGDDTDIAVGQSWNVYALGEEMIDPGTKESLGKEEVKIGEARITEVNPKFSKADIVGEDNGIARGNILRRSAQP